MNKYFKHKDGSNKGVIKLFALSTCIWCRRTKQLLDEIGVAYDFVDVDVVDEDIKDDVTNEQKKYNPECSFPTLVIDDDCIVGYDPDKIREKLDNGY